MPTLGEILQATMEYRHVTTHELAKASGVGYNTIYRTLKGIHGAPNFYDLARLAKTLMVSLDEFAAAEPPETYWQRKDGLKEEAAPP